MEEEEWRDVVGYEDLYAVSNMGVVKSKDRRVFNKLGFDYTRKGRLNKQTISNGYYVSRLRSEGISLSVKTHRIIAMAFIPNPENKPYVNHIDGNKLNNSISNLEWCTASENIRHAFRLGLQNSNHIIRGVVQLDLLGNEIKSFLSQTEAGLELGLNHSGIGMCCRGELKTSGGFKWMFT